MDYHKINQQLVGNTYPLPRIGKTMRQLEGFQYATTLYLNVGYYNIRLYTTSQENTVILTQCGKVKYNCLQ